MPVIYVLPTKVVEELAMAAKKEKDVVRERTEWLGVNEAAAYLGVSRQTFYRYLGQGKVTGYRLFGSGRLRFKRADLDALFVRETEPGKPTKRPDEQETEGG